MSTNKIVKPEDNSNLEFNTDLETMAQSTVPMIREQADVKKWVQNLQKFIKLLEKPLENRQIKKYVQGSTTFDYVPIDVVEAQAMKLFFGLIKEHEPTVQVIGNEITATQRIEIFHPVAGVWISVVGWAAVQIRMRSGQDKTDPKNKLANALQLDVPHLGAECYKNALQKLGRQFGRGLRRDYLEDYHQLVPDEEQFTDAERRSIEEAKIRIGEYTSAEELIIAKDPMLMILKKSFTPTVIRVIEKVIQDKYNSLMEQK